MTPEITVVYSFRDRSVERLLESVASIRRFEHGTDVNFLVSDYGSKDPYRMKLEKACKTEGIQLIRSETEGYPWNKSIAMNSAISAVETDLFLSTDVDMIFESDIVSEVVRVIGLKKKIHCRPYWLPPSGDRKKSWLGDFKQLGGMMAMYVNDFKLLGGYNEQFQFWGDEDTELEYRARKSGFETIWLPESVKMYHLWHPVSHGIFDQRPDPMRFRIRSLLIKAAVQHAEEEEIKSAELGSLLKEGDRPILKWLENKARSADREFSEPITPDVVNQIAEALTKGEVVFVKTAAQTPILRLKRSSISYYFGWFFSKLNRFIKRFGIEIRPSVNEQNNWIFLLLEELKHLIGDLYWDLESGCFLYPKKRAKP